MEMIYDTIVHRFMVGEPPSEADSTLMRVPVGRFGRGQGVFLVDGGLGWLLLLRA